MDVYIGDVILNEVKDLFVGHTAEGVNRREDPSPAPSS
jgi:hypothetical protein